MRDVQRQPGECEEDGDDDQHTNDALLRAHDVALRLAAADAGDVTSPHAQPDQRVEDGEETERDHVAGEEDSAEDKVAQELSRHVRTADVEVVGDAGQELHRVVDRPRQLDAGGDEPDDGNDRQRPACRDERQMRVEDGEVPATSPASPTRTQRRRDQRGAAEEVGRVKRLPLEPGYQGPAFLGTSELWVTNSSSNSTTPSKF